MAPSGKEAGDEESVCKHITILRNFFSKNGNQCLVQLSIYSISNVNTNRFIALYICTLRTRKGSAIITELKEEKKNNKQRRGNFATVNVHNSSF